jgi:hypothetical protein
MSAPIQGTKKEKGAAPLQENAPSKKTLQTNNSPTLSSCTVEDILANKSTVAIVQRKKIMTLLRHGPKTTLELREHGCLMPATRIFELKHQDGHIITSELIPLFDAYGYKHSKCARYHLVEEAAEVGHE